MSLNSILHTKFCFTVALTSMGNVRLWVRWCRLRSIVLGWGKRRWRTWLGLYLAEKKSLSSESSLSSSIVLNSALSSVGDSTTSTKKTRWTICYARTVMHNICLWCSHSCDSCLAFCCIWNATTATVNYKKLSHRKYIGGSDKKDELLRQIQMCRHWCQTANKVNVIRLSALLLTSPSLRSARAFGACFLCNNRAFRCEA